MVTNIGNLAIAKFGKSGISVVCIVTGKSELIGPDFHIPNQLSFFYWEGNERGVEISFETLPQSHFIHVQPIGKWDGNILKLTLNNVEPV